MRTHEAPTPVPTWMGKPSPRPLPVDDEAEATPAEIARQIAGLFDELAVALERDEERIDTALARRRERQP